MAKNIMLWILSILYQIIFPCLFIAATVYGLSESNVFGALIVPLIVLFALLVIFSAILLDNYFTNTSNSTNGESK